VGGEKIRIEARSPQISKHGHARTEFINYERISFNSEVEK